MVSWTALITGLSQNEREEEAVGLFMLMLRDGFVPNEFTLGGVLKATAALGEREGRQVHGICVKGGYDEDVYVGSAIVDVYARCGGMEEAKMVFERLKIKTEVCWNALIAGYARRSEAEEAVQLFMRMQRGGFQSSHFTYSNVFSACASIGALEQGKWFHGHLMKYGLGLVALSGTQFLICIVKQEALRMQEKFLIDW